MNMMEAIEARHAVRSYTDQQIGEDVRAQLQVEIDACNQEGRLHMQAAYDEPKAFGGMMARYGRFSNVHNYVALVGAKASDLDERVGYYGQRVVLAAQHLGLNTCWVGLTYSKGKTHVDIAEGEQLVCVLSLGYGKEQGKAHKSKAPEAVSSTNGEAPAWFASGIEAALLAPTALNQQKFHFSLESGGEEGGPARVIAETKKGSYAKVDLGIAKLHFELGAGIENFVWTH